MLTRRAFALRSAATVGGLVAAPLFSSAAAFHGMDDTIRVGLVGCGGRGTGAALQAIKAHPRTKLVAMADVFRDRLDDSYKAISDPKYTDWSGVAGGDPRIQVPEENRFVGFDAYQKLLPLVDVVILAAPPGFRPQHFAAAVDAGKHVFMEKPVATDAPGVRQVLAAAEKAKAKKLNVVVGLQRHYQQVYREWVKRLQDGAIGPVLVSRVYWNQDTFAPKDLKGARTEMQKQLRNWYYYTWLSGDHIVEQHVHNIDVSNWVKGQYPAKAQGQGGRQVRVGPQWGEIYDHHFVEYEYPDGSIMESQCRQINGCLNRVTEIFHGSKGSAPAPGTILDASGNVIWKAPDYKDNPYQTEHDELFAAIEKGEYRFEDATNAAKSTLTAIMGRMATYTGQQITWDQALNSTQNLFPDTLAWEANPKSMPDASGNYPIPTPGQTKFV